MAPNTETQIITDEFHIHDFRKEKVETDLNLKTEIIWTNVIYVSFIHILGFYGLYLFPSCNIYTVFYVVGMAYLFFAPSVVIGAHRLYTHRTMKAVWPLRLFLMIGFTALGQNSMYSWVRDHRMHHKYTDTDADPHNSKRGLFFSHMGWLMCRKNPILIEKAKTIMMSDLEKDPMVMFQKKYYYYLYILTNIIYILIPVYIWSETIKNSFLCCFATHYIVQRHEIWTINSLAHYVGTKPYDSNIQAADNWIVQQITMGEGMHNYHHTFPWDWRCANSVSVGGIKNYSYSTFLIQVFAFFGLIYDRRTASQEQIAKRAQKTGDGTYKPKLQ